MLGFEPSKDPRTIFVKDFFSIGRPPVITFFFRQSLAPAMKKIGIDKANNL